MITPDHQQLLARRTIPSRWIVVNAAAVFNEAAKTGAGHGMDRRLAAVLFSKRRWRVM
jgi:hypothetical protein